MSIDIEDISNDGLDHLHINNIKLRMCEQYEPLLKDILSHLDENINSKKNYMLILKKNIK